MALKKSDQRALIILGVVVVAAVLVYFVFLRGGGGEETPAGGVAAGGVPSTAVSPGTAGGSPGPSAAATPPPPPNDFVIGGRDPFSPIPLPSASASPSPQEQSDKIDINGETLTLNDILDSQTPIKVDVSVGDKSYKVQSGGTFHRNYTVTAIAGTCADFKYDNPNASSGETQHKAFNLCVAS